MERVEGSVLSCHNVQYTVDVKPPGKPCSKKEAKHIIRGVNGIFKPGVNAIMGPTGSGKTSLLDILAGRKERKGITGELLVDSKKQPKNFKCKTGYVVQDDMVMGTLSVRENLQFSANVRLSQHISQEEKEARVDAVIRELGLTHCEHTKIGNEFIRGVSGGERKRTNIGMELIISPSVLFLDEPTTGLDSSTANAVILLLNRLGRKGRTIILSIHQPRYSIFRMFDRLMLLALGKAVYNGPADEALSFFSFIGHECDAHNNPPDFFLDVINGDSSAVSEVDNLRTDNSQNGDINEIPMIEIGDSKESSLAEELSKKYSESDWGREVTKELAPIYESFKRSSSHEDDDGGAEIVYATGFATQLFTIMFFGIIVGSLYFQVDDSAESGLQNRLGAFFFIIMNSLFSNMPTVELFIKERDIFIHENGGGFYRVSTYYLSKVFCDLLPLRIIPTLFYSVLVYFMIGFEIDVGKFFFFTLNIILTMLTGAAIGFFYSSSVNIFAVAQLCISLTYIVMLLFGGLMVNINSIWEGIRWLQWFSLFRYAFNAFCVNELKGLMFYSNGTAVGYLGEEFMDNAGIPYDTDWDLWLNEFALGMMSLGLLILTFIQLLRMKKYK